MKRSSPAGRTLKQLLTALERLSCPWQRLVMLVASVIFLRGILEGVLEHEHLLGIRAVPGVSQAMLFVHFPAFYAAAFLMVALMLHRWSGRPVVSTSIITAKFWPLILAPPVLDAVVSGGQGYEMRYLGTAGEVAAVLRGFFSGSSSLPGVTPGMRIEIALACLGTGIYAGVWRGVVRGIGAAVSTFVALLILGSIPMAGGVGIEGWMHSGGFGNLQSHRLAMVNLLAAAALGVAVWHQADSGSLRAWMRGFRWLRSLLYAALTGLGVWVVFTVQQPWIDAAFSRTGDWLSLASVLIAQVLCFQSAALSNDLADEPWDRASPRRRALHEGMSLAQARRAASVLAVLGLALALCVQYAVFLIMLSQLVLAAGYSFEPVRLKRRPLLGTAVVSLAATLAVAAGAAMIGREWVFRIVPARFFGALWVSFMLGFGIKDIADEAADRAAGAWSLPVALGSRATTVLALCAFLAFALFSPLSGIGMLLVPGLTLGGACAAVVALRKPWSERMAILMLLGAVAGIAIGVVSDRAWLREARGSMEEICERGTPRFPEASLAVRMACPVSITPHALASVWVFAGRYPWLVPKVAEGLEPGIALWWLSHMASAGVCPGLAASVSLEPLVRVADREGWCHALGGAVAGGREDGSLIAVAARQADLLGLAAAADALRARGLGKWPRSAAVWAELARAHLAAERPDEALEAILHAQTLDPESAELQRDVHVVRAACRRMADRGGGIR